MARGSWPVEGVSIFTPFGDKNETKVTSVREGAGRFERESPPFPCLPPPIQIFFFFFFNLNNGGGILQVRGGGAAALQAHILRQRQGRVAAEAAAEHVKVPHRLPPHGAHALRRHSRPCHCRQPRRSQLPALRAWKVRSSGAYFFPSR